jgi:hypothetical protein
LADDMDRPAGMTRFGQESRRRRRKISEREVSAPMEPLRMEPSAQQLWEVAAEVLRRTTDPLPADAGFSCMPASQASLLWRPVPTRPSPTVSFCGAF